MKSFSLALIAFFASSAFAADVGQITMSQPQTESLTLENSNVTEAGLRFSSVNDGSVYATVGVIHEFENGFGLGVRGYMPVEFKNQSQAYMGEIVSRFMLLNAEDQMYIDGSLTGAFFNGKGNGEGFALIGAEWGYKHQFTPQIAAGGNIGVDYSDRRVSDNTISNDSTLYSKASVFGAFYF